MVIFLNTFGASLEKFVYWKIAISDLVPSLILQPDNKPNACKQQRYLIIYMYDGL